MASVLVLFISNASISKSMACFHFLLINALDTVGIVVVFRHVRKVLWVGENFLKVDSLLKGKVV